MPSTAVVLRAAGRIRLGSLLWLGTLQFFVIEALVQSRWTVPYTRRDYYISDLGALGCAESSDGRWVCSPWHLVMNVSFVVQGLLIIGGSLLLRPEWAVSASRRTSIAITTLLVVTGGGIIVVGLAPEDTVHAAHYLGAAANFAAGNLGLVALALATRRARGLRGAATWTAGLGALGLVALGCFVGGATWGIGIGGIERVIAYTIPAGLPVVAVALLLRASNGTPAARET